MTKDELIEALAREILEGLFPGGWGGGDHCVFAKEVARNQVPVIVEFFAEWVAHGDYSYHALEDAEGLRREMGCDEG